MSQARRQRQAERLRTPTVWDLVVSDIRRGWKKIFLVLGVGGGWDLLREWLRSKLMEWMYARLGALGQWMLVYPLAFLTLAVIAIVIVLVAVAVAKTTETEHSPILNSDGQPFVIRRSRRWVWGACASGLLSIVMIGYGAYRLYTVRPQALLEKYPLGYVVFDVDKAESVIPYQSRRILNEYDIDWSVVGVSEPSRDRIVLRLPELRDRRTGSKLLSNASTGGPKRVGELGGYVYGPLVAWGEILAIKPTGIVFLVGFERAPQFKPTAP